MTDLTRARLFLFGLVIGAVLALVLLWGHA